MLSTIMPSVVTLDGNNLTLSQLLAVARQHVPVALDDAALARVEASRKVVIDVLRDDRVVYGVTTGFGALQDKVIPSDKLGELQRNIVLSHAAGVGEEMPVDAMRAMMALRANTLVKGYSGVRPIVIEALIELLNSGVVPVAFLQGSVGASGDLAPLAHMACVLIGSGTATFNGNRMSGADALKSASLTPLMLEAKEGLGLTNGTQFMTGIGALSLADALELAKVADVAAALTLEALKGRSAAFTEVVGKVRPHPGPGVVADNIRRLVEGSQLVDCVDSHTTNVIQDAYSVRCVPQVHGATRSALDYVHQTLTTEMNSTSDNPIVSPDDSAVVSGGNFHGQPIALALDFLAIAVSELGNISERRCARLMDNRDSRGLPAFLIADGGLHSGLMIAQYTAAALVSENKSLAHPASVDSIPTSANQEDHNSMGSIASRHARSIVDNVCNVLAIEILSACQALDFRLREGRRLGRGTQPAFDALRTVVDHMDADREIHVDIHKVAKLITDGVLVGSVEQQIGALL